MDLKCAVIDELYQNIMFLSLSCYGMPELVADFFIMCHRCLRDRT